MVPARAGLLRKREKSMKTEKHCGPVLRRVWRAGIRILTMVYGVILLSAMPVRVSAEEGYDRVAGTASMGRVNESLASCGMTPISGNMIEDGEYVVGTECSSSFFRIEEARLTVRDGEMTAVLKMYSSSYLLVYPGTAEEAAAAPYEAYIPAVDMDGWDTFTIPVEALDTELDLAAFSKKKKMWYPRRILFHAADLPADRLRFVYPDYDRIEEAMARLEAQGGTADPGERDKAGGPDKAAAPDPSGKNSGSPDSADLPDSRGETAGLAEGTADPGEDPESPQAVSMELPDGRYSIETDLAGGSGRASVTSPTWLTVREGRGYARLLWSSPYYDYLILDGKKYTNETTDGGSSSFTIPVTALDAPVEIIADTTAMGDPVEIAYTLTFYSDTVGSWKRVPQEGARMVLTGAVLFIVAGGIVNHFVKKRRQT